MPPPEPSWLGNAQAGLIDAAILSLPVVVYKYRRRWFGWLTGIVWLACVAVLVSYSVRGQGLTFVPALLTRSVPAWKALLIALVIAGIGAAILWLRQRPRAPSEPLPIEVWNDLSDDGRDVLVYAWTKTDGRLSRSHVHQLELSLGAGWHTVANHLQSEGLLRPVFGGQYRLTQRAWDVLSKVPVINQGSDPPKPPSATAAPPELLPVAEPPEAALWRSLNSNERDVLNNEWGITGRFIFLRDCEPWRNLWGVQEWNAVIHNLTSQDLIGEDSRPLPLATSRLLRGKGIYLTNVGAALMTRVSRQKPPAE